MDIYTMLFCEVHQLHVQRTSRYRINELSFFPVRLESRTAVGMMNETAMHGNGDLPDLIREPNFLQCKESPVA
jgi:hypothetical protein